MVMTAILVALAASLVGLTFYQPFPLVRLVQHVCPSITFHQPGRPGFVALTLDDGPDPDVTPAVLDILKAQKVKATWFLIGEHVVRHPDIYRRIRAEGHQVANHLWDDTPTWRLDREAFRESLRRTEAVIVQTGQPMLYRPASGWVRPWVPAEARRLGYRTVLGSAYTSDPIRPPGWYIRWALARMARSGAILILHVGATRDLTPAVLPGLIADVRAKGLEFVDLSELLANQGGPR